MSCVIEEIKQILESYKRDSIDEIDVYILLEKLINNKCAKTCLLRQQIKIIETRGREEKLAQA